MRIVAAAAVLLAVAVGSTATASSRSRQAAQEPFPGVLDEHPAIRYASRQPRDPVARLAERLATGAVALSRTEPGGYLSALLDALDISPASQLLVASKTGIQRSVTSPRTPRALYFNDAVVVGYIPGAPYLEIASHDPEQGVIFYTVDQQAPSPAPRRQVGSCLTCHVSGSTLEIPGMIVRSNHIDATGAVMPQLGSVVVNHRTPIAERWGGWFVTGRYDAPAYSGVLHRGNVTTTLHPDGRTSSGTSNEVFVRWINSEPATLGYMSADSDIAALMVFDHQMHGINLLTRLNWEYRVAARSGSVDLTQGLVADLVRELADYLLFVDEAPPPARVIPSDAFARAFTAAGPRDGQGRSLRELDLEHRLLRYPCSYMIHSEAFSSLPPEVRTAVYDRMWKALSGQDDSGRYSHLSSADRRAIIEILRDTKSDVPAVFRMPTF